ncbi:GFA family protein [Shewanella colwelliana]|uniref:Aldehyde-activating protein n=1 Tax=Shewanella colwelliana TaxID=23 RepID=A0A1E5IXN7_SHECO|nr:GFA family protein [Shewanella colwelliana]MDX1283217.1 GFA family protein [Shewanella colwelliana]OEG74928.1 aldehyde-activating protein [Shewanella colwelliana]
METTNLLQGGCLCGALRYQVSAMPFDSDYCHCSQCQKSSGAVAVSWMDFNVEQITWLKGAPTEYASSTTIRRGFCNQCGTSISYRSTDYPNYYTLTIASLDEPNRVPPKYHIYTDNQVAWLKIADDLPKYRGGRSEGES